MCALEGTASISDVNGNLLFYTNGRSVWDSNHNLIENGLLGELSSTQAAMIIPRPSHPGRYYIFTTAQWGAGYMYWSEVNVSGTSVTMVTPINNQVIYPNQNFVSEKLTATCSDNNTDIWVIGHVNSSDAFIFLKITSNGPVFDHLQNIGPAYNSWSCVGQMKVSPGGSQLALANAGANTIEIYDFDHAGGLLTNFRNYPATSPWGVEFSPNGQMLYASGNFDNSNSDKLNQFTIYPTYLDLTYAGSSASGYLGSLQLGPDGKIYGTAGWVNTNEVQMDVINNPDLPGVYCDYSHHPGFTIVNPANICTPYENWTTQGLPNNVWVWCDECCDKVSTGAWQALMGVCNHFLSPCAISNVQVTVTNGDIYFAQSNNSTITPGYIGESQLTLTSPNLTDAYLKMCLKAYIPGIVTINYHITFSDGAICDKTETVDVQMRMGIGDCEDFNNFASGSFSPFKGWSDDGGTSANQSIYLSTAWSTYDGTQPIILRNRNVVGGTRQPVSLLSPIVEIGDMNSALSWAEVSFSAFNSAAVKSSSRKLYIREELSSVWTEIDYYPTNLMPDAFLGDPWRIRNIPLTAYANKNVQFKWECLSANDEYNFWMIDNVCIKCITPEVSNWHRPSTPPIDTVWKFAVSGTGIFAGTDSGVYYSSDNGETWTQRNGTFPMVKVKAIATNGTELFAGTAVEMANNKIYKSTDLGLTWTDVTPSIMAFNHQVCEFIFSGADIFAGAGVGGFLKSPVSGLSATTWAFANSGFPSTHYVHSIVMNGTDLYAGCYPGVFKSNDNGATWTGFNNGWPMQPYVSALLPVNGNDLFAGCIFSQDNLYHSLTGTANWSLSNNGISTNTGVLALAANENSLFAGTENEGVYRSTDNGVSWSPYSNGLSVCSMTVCSFGFLGTNIFIGTACGIFTMDLCDGTIGKQEVSMNPTRVKIYPNPASKHLTVEILDFTNPGELTIMDIQGKLLCKELLTEKSTRIDISNLPDGIYFTLYFNGKDYQFNKFIKQE